MKGLFLTGTDTGVGKSVVTATLCRRLRAQGVDAVAIKPFATGIGPDTHWRDNDPLILSAAMDGAEPPEVISPLRLLSPLSPFDAANVNRATFDVEAIAQTISAVAARHEVALIEGVGGVAVPLTHDVYLSDFIVRMGLPAVLVARSRLGTINHTLMSAKWLRDAGVHIEGAVFVRPTRGEHGLDERVGPETACRFGRLANFGEVERIEAMETAGTVEEYVRALPVDDAVFAGLAEHVINLTR